MRFLFIFSMISLMGAAPFEASNDEVYESMLALHKTKNWGYIWYECGKKIKQADIEERAREYSGAIIGSVESVRISTGFYVDPIVVRAIVYQESSDDACAVGTQEISRLSKALGKSPGRNEIRRHIRKWSLASKGSRLWCLKHGIGFEDCRKEYLKENHPRYAGIDGWDIGATQFRWPSSSLSKRSVMLPTFRRVTGISIDELLDYEVSIHLLVENLAYYYKTCRKHKHWIKNRSGQRERRLKTIDAYYVHHHSGPISWSQRNWNNIGRRLRAIKKMKSIAIAKEFFIDSIRSVFF